MSISIRPLFIDNPLQNYVWLVVNTSVNEAIVVDPTSADMVQDYIQLYNLSLVEIWVTHDHHDHVAGVAELKRLYPNVRVVGHAQHKLPKQMRIDIAVDEGSFFHAWGREVQVWSLEGHKKYHIGYLLEDQRKNQHVFSGDILFSAGCGRNFEGTLDELYDSLQRLAGLPDDTVLYPTHEFTINNLNFAKSIVPDDNATLDALNDAHAKRAQCEPTLPVTLEHEKRTNLFLRVDEVDVIAGVVSHVSLECELPRAVFKALRGLKDKF